MNFFGKKKKKNIGERQRKKITADFNIFFDTKRSGQLTWENIEQLQSHVLIVTGWQSDSVWWLNCREFFKEVWQTMLTLSATKNAHHVTAEEWYQAWVTVIKDKQDFDKKSAKATMSSKKSTKPITENPKKKSNKNSGKTAEPSPPKNPAELEPKKPAEQAKESTPENSAEPENSVALENSADSVPEKLAENGLEDPAKKIEQASEVNGPEVAEETEPEQEAVEFPEYFPSWVRKYFEYKFRLYDRSGDGSIDLEEFEYVLWDDFGVSPGDCREAFKILSQDNKKVIDRRYFLELFIEYFLFDDVTCVGNQLNGKLAE